MSDSVAGAAPVLEFPRELEPFDYLMFRSESDPRGRTGALTVAMLDVVPDMDRLRQAFDRASRTLLRLRQHVVVPALPLGAAEWVTDPDFDASPPCATSSSTRSALDTPDPEEVLRHG